MQSGADFAHGWRAAPIYHRRSSLSAKLVQFLRPDSAQHPYYRRSLSSAKRKVQQTLHPGGATPTCYRRSSLKRDFCTQTARSTHSPPKVTIKAQNAKLKTESGERRASHFGVSKAKKYATLHFNSSHLAVAPPSETYTRMCIEL